jgi:hypothetical protein
MLEIIARRRWLTDHGSNILPFRTLREFIANKPRRF